MRFVGCWKTWGIYVIDTLRVHYRNRGNELTVCAGGRYDGLVEYFGGLGQTGFWIWWCGTDPSRSWKRKALNYRSKTGLDAYYCRLGGDEVNEAALSSSSPLRIQAGRTLTILDAAKLKRHNWVSRSFAAKALIATGSSELVKSLWEKQPNSSEVTVALGLKKDFPSVLAELGLAW